MNTDKKDIISELLKTGFIEPVISKDRNQFQCLSKFGFVVDWLLEAKSKSFKANNYIQCLD